MAHCPAAQPAASAIDRVVRTPGLVAFWTFGEPAGQPRRSVGTAQPHPLEEVGGPIERVEGGPFSGYAAGLQGGFFRIAHEDTGDLNICGRAAQVSMFAAVCIDDVAHCHTIAGMWDEGRGAFDDSGARQYAMLLDMGKYGGRRRLTPHISSEGGVTRRADGSPLPWNADYAVPRSQVPERQWCTLGFTYDGQSIRAYVNGAFEERPLQPEQDGRTDRYFTHEGPGGGDRGMNPYFHGRGIFRYEPALHAVSKPRGGSDFTVGSRVALGRVIPAQARIGGLAVFHRALTDAEMHDLHVAANVAAMAR